MYLTNQTMNDSFGFADFVVRSTSWEGAFETRRQPIHGGSDATSMSHTVSKAPSQDADLAPQPKANQGTKNR